MMKVEKQNNSKFEIIINVDVEYFLRFKNKDIFIKKTNKKKKNVFHLIFFSNKENMQGK